MILVIGDVMIDKYTYGVVRRISPEAPVPVLFVEEEEWMLGGAGNVARNVHSLGHDCALLCVCGDDERKKWIEQACNACDIIPLLLCEKERETTLKHRFIAKPFNHYLLRVDHEDTWDIKKETEMEIMNVLAKINMDLLIVSDYDKGMLTGGLIKCIKSLGCKVLVDTKPKKFDMYNGVFVLKPNIKEACSYVGMEEKNDDATAEKVGVKMMEKLDSNIIITRGEKGATLVKMDGDVKHIKARERKIYDVAGAGDTFLAALAVALVEGSDLEEAVHFANNAAGRVVEKVGTSVVTREELKESF